MYKKNSQNQLLAISYKMFLKWCNVLITKFESLTFVGQKLSP